MTDKINNPELFPNASAFLISLLHQNADLGQTYSIEELGVLISQNTKHAKSTGEDSLVMQISRTNNQVKDSDLVIERIWKGSDRYAFYKTPPRLDSVAGSLSDGDYDNNARLPHLYYISEDKKEFVKLNEIDAKLLNIFSQNKNNLVTTDEIIKQIYGDIDERFIPKYRNAISVRISDLRNVLESGNYKKRDQLRRSTIHKDSSQSGFKILSIKGKAEGAQDPGYVWANLDDPSGKASYPSFTGFTPRTFVVNNSEGKPVFLLESEQRLLTILLLSRDKHKNFEEMIGDLSSIIDISLPARPYELWHKLREKLEPNISEQDSVFEIKVENKGRGKTYRRRFTGGD